MCGIAGYHGDDDPAALLRALDAQAHRGPDDSGTWLGQGVALGHRRLAILDRSRAGHQPMQDASGRLHLVLNGEIYNFQELRQSLEAKGYNFSSQTDTEVVLAAYHAWGLGCLRRLVGMFALALVDTAPPPGAPAMVLARDRLGIKPLVYAQGRGRLWFASELTGLMAAGKVSRGVDAAALIDYVSGGAIAAPNTLLEDVRTLLPGCYMALRQGQWCTSRYWHLHHDTAELRDTLRDVSTEAAAEQLAALLHEAGRCHLLADVPVGAFLSGGIDSAAVAAIMRPHLGRPLRTYSIGFAGERPHLDERAPARASAAYLQTRHHELRVADAEGADLFAHVVRSIRQPSADGVNTLLVSRFARQDVTVALSGLGADEILGGYGHFAWTADPPRSGPLQRHLTQHVSRALWNVWPYWRLTRSLYRHSPVHLGMRVLRRQLADGPLLRAMQPTWHAAARRRWRRPTHDMERHGADPLQRVSYAEAHHYLLNTLLRDADAMSMSQGLELRPLFLHHPLVEFAYALPPQHKVAGGRGKRVLVRALGHRLPPHVVEAPKRGFEMPLRAWMKTPPLRHHLDHLLHTDNARRLFRPSYRQQLRLGAQLGRPAHALWAWGILLGWLEEHGCVL